MLFDAQNIGNRISERLGNLHIFLGGMLLDPPRGKGPCGPLSGHSCLLHPQWLLVTNIIETPWQV